MLPQQPPIDLPAPVWLFLTVLFLIFFLHLLSMWMLVGGLFIGLVDLPKQKLEWKESKAIRYLPIVMAFVINLGIPPLLVLQILYGPLLFSSSILMAVPWISVFVLLIVGYGSIYAAKYLAKSFWQAFLFLIISIVSVLVISFFFSNNMSLMLKPDLWQSVYTYQQDNGLNLHPNLLTEVVPRWLWILSPVFVTGAALLRSSRKWAWVSGVISIIALVPYVISLKESGLLTDDGGVKMFLGVDFALSGLLLVLPFIQLKEKLHVDIMTWSVIALKALSAVLLRHAIRVGLLEDVYSLDSLQITPVPALIAIFLIGLAVGLTTFVWMFRKGYKELNI